MVRLGASVLVVGQSVVRSHEFCVHRKVGSPRVVLTTLARWAVDEITLLALDGSCNSARALETRVSDWVGAARGTPLLVGGGIRSADVARRCIAQGADRVLLGHGFWEYPRLASECAALLGAQSVVVSFPCIAKGSRLYRWDAQARRSVEPSEAAMSELRSGSVSEILVQDVERDGAVGAPDTRVFDLVGELVPTPVIAAGGMSDPTRAVSVADRANVVALSVGNINSEREHALDPVRKALGPRVRDVTQLGLP